MSNSCQNSDPFVLRVTSNKMSPEFPHGSIIVVDPSHPVRHKDFVIARVSGEVELGKIFTNGNVWELVITAGEGTPPISIQSSDIVGRVMKCVDSRRNPISDFS